MASKEPTPFQRVFSRRDLLRGAALRAVLGFALSSLLLCCGLIVLFLITDLLVHRGRLTIPAGSQLELAKLIGPELLHEAGAPPAAIVGGEVIYANRGLLPTLWHAQDEFWQPMLCAVWRGFSPLRNDDQALLTLVAIAALIGWFRSMLASRSRRLLVDKSLEIATRLRQSIHRQSLRLGPSDLEGRASEQAFGLFTTDVDRLREGVVHWAVRIGRDPLKLLLLLALAVLVSPSLAVVCLVPAAACWYVAQREQHRADEVRTQTDARTEIELRLLAESLERTRLVRGYGMEAFEQANFDKSLQRFQHNTATALRAQAWARRGMRTLVAGCAAFILYFVGRAILLSPQEIPYASGLLMLSAFVAAGFPLQNLARLRSETEPAESAAKRIQAYLNLIPEVGQAVGAKFVQPLSRMLSVENVSYTTPGKRKLLDGLTLKIPAGRQVAIVASEPLEGLALACLLPRFIEPQEGRILIDGEDIAWVTLESLRAETIFVGGADPFLTATIRENISGGNPNCSLQDVTEAAKIAHAHNFVTKLPHGYETVIGEHGEQLDSGQTFRLGLARAILRKPALLVIEEPSELLDEDTKTMLDDAYKRIAPNRTVLYLARRLSTVKRADEIVLIHRGRLAAIGPHARLVQSSPMYRHWEYINFNEFRHEFEAE
ncbi:MAG: ABC transporter ATP-binding protein [Planctomycetaceae bacterium]|nr:ABC transporter ATP-binding protein [Planctomycetaceae bacterium]